MPSAELSLWTLISVPVRLMLLETGWTGTQAMFVRLVPDVSAWSRLGALAVQAWGAWENPLPLGSCHCRCPQPLSGLHLNGNLLQFEEALDTCLSHL